MPSDRVSSVAGQEGNCDKDQASPRRQATARVAPAPVRKPLESDVELNVMQSTEAAAIILVVAVVVIVVVVVKQQQKQ